MMSDNFYWFKNNVVLELITNSEYLGIDGQPFKMKVKNKLVDGATLTLDPNTIKFYAEDNSEQIVDDGYIYDFKILSKDCADFLPKEKVIFGTELFELKKGHYIESLEKINNA